MSNRYRNISFAAAGSFEEIMEKGDQVTVRGQLTREILNQVTVLDRPLERFLFLPGRLNDCFAQIAESIWVLAGRNDVDWLTHYLPRAPDFSDDRKTWRAGYGPRLRRWRESVDQVDEVRKLLVDDRTTRRAVMSLFDPGLDYVNSKDIPCNNWIGWLIRDGRLNMSIAIRSNDAMWGFSGANAFEWSVLHELMARWTGTEVGSATFFAASFHLYERHFNTAPSIVSRFHGISPYDFDIPRLPLSVSWSDLADRLAHWFELEQRIRTAPGEVIAELQLFDDRFLRGALEVLRLKWLEPQLTDTELAAEMANLDESDMVAATYQHLGRRRPALLRRMKHTKISSFFSAFEAER
ncbi:thymidylate synthase [Sinorhizobium fredii]|uniref:Deoxyuridylate hydroxymethylrase domain-containing protein n=1 Tax=Rhizobium fredii TaxID=380 RepID=A0A2L0HA00_RHIFR|nr:thymidylate synthase [Sinorhizobium fredii]AUX78305.1 deoxyuridylate hydroxymethylrase domain-containing protein [Sinorhizobium fredii]